MFHPCSLHFLDGVVAASTNLGFFHICFYAKAEVLPETLDSAQTKLFVEVKLRKPQALGLILLQPQALNSSPEGF